MAFPNVPIAPGVPPLPRDPGAAIAAVELLVADAISVFGLFDQQRWGLFKNNLPVVVADNVVSFDFKQDYTVSNYPLEQGAFESYDKVTVPFDVRLQFSMGGSELDRQEFLQSITAIAGTLDLFDAVTPEQVYPSVNVVHCDYRRTSGSGLGLLVVDVWCLQVRVTAQTSFSSSTVNPSGALAGASSGAGAGAFQSGNTKAPAGADPIGVGNVQPTDAAPLRIDVHPTF